MLALLLLLLVPMDCKLGKFVRPQRVHPTVGAERAMDGLLSGHRDCPRAPAHLSGGGRQADALAAFDNSQTWHTGDQQHTEKAVGVQPAVVSLPAVALLPMLAAPAVHPNVVEAKPLAPLQVVAGPVSPAVAAAAAAAVGGVGWRRPGCWEEGVLYTGSNLDTLAAVASAQECNGRCTGRNQQLQPAMAGADKCVGFTYCHDQALCGARFRHCWLKATAHASKSFAGAVR